jgi:outer membrane protein
MCLIKRIFAILPLLLITTSGYAQKEPTRTAYIESSKILSRMTEAQDADMRLDQLVAVWNQEAENIQGELNRKKAEFERKKLIMTDAERSAAEVDLQNVQRRLTDFRQSKYGPNGELYSQQASMMKPAYDKLMKAIDEIAKEGNYDYVMDKSSKDVAILFSNSRHDITVKVAKKLGIETDVIMQPLINTPTGSSSNQPNTQSINQQNFDGQPPASNPSNPADGRNGQRPDRAPARERVPPSGNVPSPTPVK